MAAGAHPARPKKNDRSDQGWSGAQRQGGRDPGECQDPSRGPNVEEGAESGERKARGRCEQIERPLRDLLSDGLGGGKGHSGSGCQGCQGAEVPGCSVPIGIRGSGFRAGDWELVTGYSRVAAATIWSGRTKRGYDI